MSDVTTPAGAPAPQRPAHARLVRSLLISALVAGVITVTVVLPAECGIDPTGVGQALGLKEMGEIKQRLELEALEHE